MLETFRWLGEETAARFGYTYPTQVHEQVTRLVTENFPAANA